MFQLQKRLQNSVNALLKCFFFSKNYKLNTFLSIRFASNFAGTWAKYVSNKVWRDFRLPVSVFASVARKSFNGKFTASIDFPIGHCMLPLLTLTLEVNSHSLHYLISIWTTGWWNLNEIVWYKIHHFGRRFYDINNYSMKKY